MTTSTYDFDLHGIVGIRLLDATEADLATVTRQLGPLRAVLDREPDLTVRFVDRATSEPVTYVGLGDSGFNGDGFLVLRGKGGVAARASLPLDQVGRRPEIRCERAMPAVPHLLTLVNLTALGKGVLPLHATAFTVDSLGVLVTGWSKSGKTEALLAATGLGAHYVGDEWIYLTPDAEMLGLPEPIRLWAWHFDQRPALLGARPRAERLRLGAWRGMAALARAGSASGAPAAGLVRRGRPVVERQAYLQVPPGELFGDDRVRLHGRMDAVVLMLSHDRPDIVVGSAGPTELSGRMRASLAEERASFMAHYRQFRYAFPDRRSTLVETAEDQEAALLSRLFDHRDAATVAHPYPCDLTELGHAVLAAARDVAKPGPVAGEVRVR